MAFQAPPAHAVGGDTPEVAASHSRATRRSILAHGSAVSGWPPPRTAPDADPLRAQALRRARLDAAWRISEADIRIAAMKYADVVAGTRTRVDGALLDKLREMTGYLRECARGLSDGDLRVRPAGQEFSVVEHACHLRDLELEGYAARIDRILAEERPFLADFDGTRIARERGYATQDGTTAIAAFAAARESNVRRIATLTCSELQRVGRLEGVGDITLATLLERMLDHDRGHCAELAALRDLLDATRS